MQARLTEKKRAFLAKADTTKIAEYEKGIADVAATGITKNALNVGDTAPDFTLMNAVGEKVGLYQELQKGPVVLTWYRGGWCPYCNITLSYLQETLPAFTEHGASLMALTPELPDKALSTKEKNALEFQVLSDTNNWVAEQYGLKYTLPANIATRYESGFGLSQYNGNAEATLPLAATYVVDKNGVIQYAFLDADYRNRAEPSAILKVLEAL